VKKHFEPFEPTKEQLAFFYQQTQELEQYTNPLGSLTMLVEEHTPVKKPKQKVFGVTFVVAPEKLKFRVRVEGPNLYETCVIAKEEAKLKLTSLMAALPKRALLAPEKKAPVPKEMLH
jgi:hypothetical protein